MRDDAIDVAAQLVVQALGHLVHRRGHRRPRRVGADGPPGEQDLPLGSGAVLDARVLLLDEDRALACVSGPLTICSSAPTSLRAVCTASGATLPLTVMSTCMLSACSPGARRASAEDHGRGCGELRRAQAPGGTFTEARGTRDRIGSRAGEQAHPRRLRPDRTCDQAPVEFGVAAARLTGAPLDRSLRCTASAPLGSPAGR